MKINFECILIHVLITYINGYDIIYIYPCSKCQYKLERQG